MTDSRRRPRRETRHPSFSLRQTVLFFGLVAIALCAAGLALKLLVDLLTVGLLRSR
ncbi:hypothetical protein [Streptomyces sp. NPDC053427]|uniref:hypothetical protein n=1 Tax=Streptomyces sp. NPDC053427 TaxID=3365701 RepID=UPI0037D41A1E